jgi:hypothetical protein
MTGNSNFRNPPVDLVGLKADIDVLSALMAESLDGSKKVLAEKRKQKEVVVRKLRLLGRYVEVTCKNDMAIFMSSGFEPASGGRLSRRASRKTSAASIMAPTAGKSRFASRLLRTPRATNCVTPLSVLTTVPTARRDDR